MALVTFADALFPTRLVIFFGHYERPSTADTMFWLEPQEKSQIPGNYQ